MEKTIKLAATATQSGVTSLYIQTPGQIAGSQNLQVLGGFNKLELTAFALMQAYPDVYRRITLEGGNMTNAILTANQPPPNILNDDFLLDKLLSDANDFLLSVETFFAAGAKEKQSGLGVFQK